APQLLETDRPPTPPAASAAPSPSPDRTGRPTVSLDPDRRQVVIEQAGRKGRVIPVSVNSAVPERQLTVVSKSAKRTLPGLTVGYGSEYDYRARWVVELVSDGGSAVFLHEWPSKSGRGLIGVTRGADAEWLYKQLEVGDTITVDHG
ncbi:L,D-transpeptidase, partial [Streptomyces sp. T-3]|nr:L,D-transpeptidase [Streptomyces sp. T-3]